MKEISLNSPKYGAHIVTVDDEDYKKVHLMNWSLAVDRTNKYAVHTECKNNIFKTIKMHRLIMGVTNPKVLIDHRDCNGLNNQKSNLRIATHGQNMVNRKKKKGTSKYLGVFKKQKRVIRKDGSIYELTRYCASIFYKKPIPLGSFIYEIDAAYAYDSMARIYHGEWANLNFPNDI